MTETKRLIVSDLINKDLKLKNVNFYIANKFFKTFGLEPM